MNRLNSYVYNFTLKKFNFFYKFKSKLNIKL